MTSLDEEILAMAEKVECHGFAANYSFATMAEKVDCHGFAANCSFAKQQIIAIHINKE